MQNGMAHSQKFTRATIWFDSNCVSLPEKLSAFLKYIRHTAWHLFFCQINYAASLFTLTSLTLFYPGVSLNLSQLGWLDPGEPCQGVGRCLCVLPQGMAIPAPHHSSSSSLFWVVFSGVCGMSVKLTWQICLCRDGRTVLFIAWGKNI